MHDFEELEEEVKNAEILATMLAEHLLNMGSDRGMIPVKYAGWNFTVTVEKLTKIDTFWEQ